MKRERRKNFRVEWDTPAIIDYGALNRPCRLVNFSNGGAKIAGVRGAMIPDEFTLRFAGGTRRCRVLSRLADTLRIEFIDRSGDQEVSNTSRSVPDLVR